MSALLFRAVLAGCAILAMSILLALLLRVRNRAGRFSWPVAGLPSRVQPGAISYRVLTQWWAEMKDLPGLSSPSYPMSNKARAEAVARLDDHFTTRLGVAMLWANQDAFLLDIADLGRSISRLHLCLPQQCRFAAEAIESILRDFGFFHVGDPVPLRERLAGAIATGRQADIERAVRAWFGLACEDVPLPRT